MKKKNLKLVGDALRSAINTLKKQGYRIGDADEEGKWVTLSNGSAVQLGEGGKLLKGMGGQHKGENIKEAAKAMKAESKPKPGTAEFAAYHSARAAETKKKVEAQKAERESAKAATKAANAGKSKLEAYSGSKMDAEGVAQATKHASRMVEAAKASNNSKSLAANLRAQFVEGFGKGDLSPMAAEVAAQMKKEHGVDVTAPLTAKSSAKAAQPSHVANRHGAAPNTPSGLSKADLPLRDRAALGNAGKFNTRKNAESSRDGQKYRTNIMQGENGQFWVPATNREESILKRLGYKEA